MTRTFDDTHFAEIVKQSPKSAVFEVLAVVAANPYLTVADEGVIPTQEVLAHLAVRGPLLGLN